MKEWEKIPSFTVNHLVLKPGIYVSRVDEVGGGKIITYDLRVTAPNKEPVMNTAEIHTLEHLGATFLRNHPVHRDNIIYFGPMGCRTGFYLVAKDCITREELANLLRATFAYVQDFEGDIPGATAGDCGNYLDQNPEMAKYYARKYLEVLRGLKDYSFAYEE